MNEQRNDDVIEQSEPQQTLPRILARRLAREVTTDELNEVSGGRMAAGGYTATSVCCDCDACDA